MPASGSQSRLNGLANRCLPKVIDVASGLISDAVHIDTPDYANLARCEGGDESNCSRSWSSVSAESEVALVSVAVCPMDMMDFYLSRGLVPGVAGELVAGYLRCKSLGVAFAPMGLQPVVAETVAAADVVAEPGGPVVSGSHDSSRSSRRRARRLGYKRTCDAMVWEDGMCYLRVVHWTRRVRLSRQLGPRPTMTGFLRALQDGDLDVTAAKVHYLVQVSDKPGAQVYHITGSVSGDQVYVGSVYDVIAALLHVFPRCVDVALGIVPVAARSKVIPLIAIVGAVSSCAGLPVTMAAGAGRVYPDDPYSVPTPMVFGTPSVVEIDSSDWCGPAMVTRVEGEVTNRFSAVQVSVSKDQSVLVVSNGWFKVSGVVFTPVAFDYGVTRAVLLTEPGEHSLLLEFGCVGASCVILHVPSADWVPDLMHACGFFVGAAEQVSGYMWQDFMYNESRLPKLASAMGNSILVASLSRYACSWRHYPYLALLPSDCVLEVSLMHAPATVGQLRRFCRVAGFRLDLRGSDCTVHASEHVVIVSKQPYGDDMVVVGDFIETGELGSVARVGDGVINEHSVFVLTL